MTLNTFSRRKGFLLHKIEKKRIRKHTSSLWKCKNKKSETIKIGNQNTFIDFYKHIYTDTYTYGYIQTYSVIDLSFIAPSCV